MPGAATQVFSREFDAAFARIPANVSALILGKIAEMGQRLESFPHYRMTGRDEFRLRVGDYRRDLRFRQREERDLSHHTRKPARSVSVKPI